MSSLADSICRGLDEAIAYVNGSADVSQYKVHIPKQVDVRSIRTKLGMTQEQFAITFGFSINTLRHWEQKRRQPEGASRAYLTVIARAPAEVRKALHT